MLFQLGFLIHLGMSSVIYITDPFPIAFFWLWQCFVLSSPSLNSVFGTADTPLGHPLSSVLHSCAPGSPAEEAREGIHWNMLLVEHSTGHAREVGAEMQASLCSQHCLCPLRVIPNPFIFRIKSSSCLSGSEQLFCVPLL